VAATETTMSAAERLFRADLAGGRFCAGVDRGYWRLHSLDWPHAILEVAYAAGWFALRFDLTGYPQAPTAQPWDIEADAALPRPRWPQGSARLNRAFNPGWRTDALYIPVDRLALEGHDGWRIQYAAYLWDPAGDICQYLDLVRDLLREAA
jgi:hypothetical protein